MKPTFIKLNSLTTLIFKGEKTLEFLQGQLTCDMRELSHHGTYSLTAVCDHRGRMLANFWVVHYHDHFLFILPKVLAQTVKAHLQKYAIFSKVTITEDAHFFIAEHSLLETPSKNYFSECIGIHLPSEHRYLILAEKNIFEKSAVNYDENHWKKNNIADELCILYRETSLLFTPQMIGLERQGGVSFTKGCYVGQEIIARTHYLGTLKRHLHALKIQSDQPVNPGDPLKNDQGEAIGVVTEAVKITENSYEILAVIQDQMFYTISETPH